MPVMPQNAAGWRMDPPVSVPVAAGVRRAATAAALPPDDPPGMRLVSHGVAHGLHAVVAYGGNGRVFVAGAHGEFIAIELAQYDHTLVC